MNYLKECGCVIEYVEDKTCQPGSHTYEKERYEEQLFMCIKCLELKPWTNQLK